MAPDKQYPVLCLASWFPTKIKPLHGIFILRHARALSLYCPVTVLYAAADPDLTGTEFQLESKKEGNLSIHIIYYPQVKSGIPGVSGLLRWKRVRKAYQIGLQALQKENFVPQRLLINVAYPIGLIVPMVRKTFNIPTYLIEHWSGYLPEDGNYKGSLMKKATENLVKQCKGILVISEKMKKAMEKHHLRGNYHFIPNVSDTLIFHPPTSIEESQSAPLRLFHASSLVEREKNIQGLLDMAVLLSAEKFPFTLSIAGNPEEWEKWIPFIQTKGLEGRISFLGSLSPDKLADQMRRADFFILSSHFEGLPVVIPEALSCGTKVISTDVGGIRATFDPRWVTCVPKANAKALAEVVSKGSPANSLEEKTKMHHYICDNFSSEAIGKKLAVILNT